MNGRIRRPSPATVISVIALCVAIGGAGMLAFAASQPRGKIVGYARVTQNGDVVASKSLNVGPNDVTTEGSAGGAYCFRHLPFTFKGLSATLDYRYSLSDASIVVAKGNPLGDCTPASNVDAEVVTRNAGTYSAQGFYVVFYR